MTFRLNLERFFFSGKKVWGSCLCFSPKLLAPFQCAKLSSELVQFARTGFFTSGQNRGSIFPPPKKKRKKKRFRWLWVLSAPICVFRLLSRVITTLQGTSPGLPDNLVSVSAAEEGREQKCPGAAGIHQNHRQSCSFQPQTGILEGKRCQGGSVEGIVMIPLKMVFCAGFLPVKWERIEKNSNILHLNLRKVCS